MPSIDLNCDLGESFGAYTIGMDAEILPYVTSANIACGFHAGDPSVMQKSVLLCKKYGVQVGAHPGLPDLQGFGRRRMAISPAEAEADVMYQIGALKAFCDAAGVPLHHVKPHGALYNMAARGSGAGGGHLPRCAGCSSRCCATGTLRQRDGQGRKRHRTARCQRGICRPRLPGRRQPCATRRSRRNDRGRGYRHCAGLADGGAGYRTGRRRQHRNPAGRFRLRPRRRPQSPRLRAKNFRRPPCRRDSSCSILIVGRKQDGE